MAIRLPFALQLAALIVLALFWGLWLTINQTMVVPPPGKAFDIVHTPIAPEKLTPPTVEKRLPPPPPSVVIGGVGPPIVEKLPPLRERGSPPPPNITWTSGESGPPSTVGTDRDPLAMVRVEAAYPQSAITRGVEGWVVVEFTVAASGAVRDARVVDSRPARTFDKAALDAVARWRYQPRVADGNAVDAVGMRTLIRFDLENE